jgi:hypothetical protein
LRPNAVSFNLNTEAGLFSPTIAVIWKPLRAGLTWADKSLRQQVIFDGETSRQVAVYNGPSGFRAW